AQLGETRLASGAAVQMHLRLWTQEGVQLAVQQRGQRVRIEMFSHAGIPPVPVDSVPATLRGPWPDATSPCPAGYPGHSTTRHMTSPPLPAAGGSRAVRPGDAAAAAPAGAAGVRPATGAPATAPGPPADHPVPVLPRVGAPGGATHHGWYYVRSATARCESAP